MYKLTEFDRECGKLWLDENNVNTIELIAIKLGKHHRLVESALRKVLYNNTELLSVFKTTTKVYYDIVDKVIEQTEDRSFG